MKALHCIEFMISEDVAIRVLYAITESFACPYMGTDNHGDVFFNVCLNKEQALEFYDRFGWALIEVCDMDQEDGGSFI